MRIKSFFAKWYRLIVLLLMFAYAIFHSRPEKISNVVGEDLLFKKIPKGYTLETHIDEEMMFGRMVIADYINPNGDCITLEVKVHSNNWTTDIEISEVKSKFKHKGIIYTMTKNYELNQVFWMQDTTTYLLYGDVPVEELKNIIMMN